MYMYLWNCRYLIDENRGPYHCVIKRTQMLERFCLETYFIYQLLKYLLILAGVFRNTKFYILCSTYYLGFQLVQILATFFTKCQVSQIPNFVLHTPNCFIRFHSVAYFEASLPDQKDI